MLVNRWMSKKVVTIDSDESLSEAINTLKRNKIRRLPVLKDNKLVGIVSDRDLKEAAPSKATSLDIWELHYMMSKIKVKDIMTRNPLTIAPESTIEKAAVIMHDKKIGGLPVLDDKGHLAGILTEQDIFEALINVTGVREGGYRLSLMIRDEPGTVKEVCDIMRTSDFKCVSILTTYQDAKAGYRELIVRFHASENLLGGIMKKLESKYENIELIKD